MTASVQSVGDSGRQVGLMGSLAEGASSPLSFTRPLPVLCPGSSSFRNGSHYTMKTKVTDVPFSSRLKRSGCHADALYSRFHSSGLGFEEQAAMKRCD